MELFSLAGAVFTTPEKLILIPAVLIFFFTVFFWCKNLWLALISTLILFLPFNSALRLDFGIFRSLYDPYIYNLEVNYLVPTVYLSDFLLALTVFALGWSYIDIKRSEIKSWLSSFSLSSFFRGFISFQNPFILVVIFYIYALFHFATHPELLVFLSTFRLFMFVVILNFMLLLNPATLRSALLKNSTFIISAIAISALLQLFIASQQIIGGTEVGLYVLGESTLEAGRKGVSFVSGFGSLFLRGYGTFPHPNILGAYLVVIGILFLLIRALVEIGGTRRNFVTTALYLFTTAIITSAILLSFSRSAFVVWCLALIGFLLRKQLGNSVDSAISALRKIKLPKLNSKNFSFGIMNLFGGIFGARESSISERISQYLIGIEILKNNLFFGVGAGSYAIGINDISRELYYERLIKSGISILQPSHNVFLTFLAEHGIIGALVVLFLLLIIIKVYLKRFIIIKKLLAFMVIIGFAALVFASLDHYLYTLPIGVTVGVLMLIISWSLLQVRKEPKAI